MDICTPVFNKKYLVKNKYGRRYAKMLSDDWLMLSVADADCLTPKPIVDVLTKKASDNFFIYVFEHEKMYESISYWYRINQNIDIKPNEILCANGVLQLINIVIKTYSDTGDGIIFATPAYPSFLTNITMKNIQRKAILHKLIYNKKTNQYDYDFKLLEKQFSNPKNKIFLLCSPHNPIGRVWTKKELEKIVKLALKHDIFIISDEIWQDFIFGGIKHHPMVSLNEDASKCSVTISSPLKTFNMGGMQFGYILIKNEQIKRKILTSYNQSISYSSTHPLTYPMVIEALTNPDCYKWSRNFVKHIENNFLTIRHLVSSKTKIRFLDIQSCFVMNVDFSKVVKSKKELEERLKKIKIEAVNGSEEGTTHYRFCLRINIAISHEDLLELSNRLIKEFGINKNVQLL